MNDYVLSVTNVALPFKILTKLPVFFAERSFEGIIGFNGIVKC